MYVKILMEVMEGKDMSLQKISLLDIRNVSRSELDSHRLNTLEDGYSSFEEVLNSSSDPIKLDGSKPYDITDGRHRIYLARQKGYSHVYAILD